MKNEIRAIEVPEDGLVRVMRRVGDPTIIPDNNMPTIYNMINNVYCDVQVNNNFSNTLLLENFRNRIVFLTKNIASCTAYLFADIFAKDEVLRKLAINTISVSAQDMSISDVLMRIENNLKYQINMNNIEFMDLEYVLSTNSFLTNMGTITNKAIGIVTSINNYIYEDIIGTILIDESSAILIADALAKLLDYVVYILCLIKYEALCIYARLGNVTVPNEVNNSAELLQYMYEYDVNNRQGVLYTLTQELYK